ncbi:MULTISPECIES: hypothetical protein [unclassified Carboxylicivirga]|uniref:hypothetical protein n=1 Tax=Carboxylicivirga TaxID=1628153 RepID=UPI003D33A355
MKTFFKIFKLELVWIPAGILLFFLFNWLLRDVAGIKLVTNFFGEVDYIALGVVRALVSAGVAWIILRIMLPNVFKNIIADYYTGFKTLQPELKYKLSTALIIGFLLAATMAVNGQVYNYNQFDRLEHPAFAHLDIIKLTPEQYNTLSGDAVREILTYNLMQQVGVKEVTTNRSPIIDEYAKRVGFKPEQRIAWCAAKSSFNYSILSIPNPNSAWSPNFAKDKDVIWYRSQGFKRNRTQFKTGDAATFYYDRLGRVGHVGEILRLDRHGYVVTHEGNSNNNGSRVGDQVVIHKRRLRSIYAVSRYIKD